MKQVRFPSKNGRRALRALVGVAALTGLACDNSMNFSPTAPDWSDWPTSAAGTRNLQISGTLEIEGGACLEATVLYDGRELRGARSRCPQSPGCARLELEASTPSETGRHTISFQVLRQSQEVLDYVAEGTVRVSREGVALGGVAMSLGPKPARLEAGEAVSFEVEFAN